MRRFWQAMLGIGLILLVQLLPVHADMGPKPSVNLTVEGFADRVCYVTLLSDRSSTGPYSASDEPIEESSRLIEADEENGVEAWEAFRAYEDEDGFYFIEFFARLSEDGSFAWTYYPPDVFKVLLYLPDEDVFYVSPIVERYAFDSYYRVMAEPGSSQLTVETLQMEYGGYGTHLASRMLVTIVVELLLAGCFKLWKRSLLPCIIVMNVLTQLLLHASLNAAFMQMGYWDCILLYVKLELGVVLIEGVAYTCIGRRLQLSMKRVWLYAATANIASFLIGWQLTTWLPGWF